MTPKRPSVRTAAYLAPRVGHTTNVSSAIPPGHPEINEEKSVGCETEKVGKSASTNRSRARGPEIWFRILHSAVPSQNCDLLEAYREQEVVVAFGPMGILEDCDIGTLTRRIDADQVVHVVPSARGILKPTEPKTSRVTELLRMAIEWRRQIDAGEVQNKAEIARREGITRARVTQVMSLLRLPPEFQEQLLTMSDIIRRSAVTERRLRPIINGTEKRSSSCLSSAVTESPVLSHIESFP